MGVAFLGFAPYHITIKLMVGRKIFHMLLDILQVRYFGVDLSRFFLGSSAPHIGGGCDRLALVEALKHVAVICQKIFGLLHLEFEEIFCCRGEVLFESVHFVLHQDEVF